MKEPISEVPGRHHQWMTHPPVSYPVCDSVRTILRSVFTGALEVTVSGQQALGKGMKMLDQSHLPGVLRRLANPWERG